MATQSEIDRIKNSFKDGHMTVDEANVEMVRTERVRLITSRVPADVRKALNAAVKSGYLGHVKKDGDKPEAYYHPTFEYLVAGERNDYERRKNAAIVRAMSAVVARPYEQVFVITD